MIPGKTYTPEDVLRIARRRWWLAVLPLMVIGSGAVAYAKWLPSRWMSSAVIAIVPQRVPESYVRTTVTTGIQDRLESIRRDILSRTKLEELVVQLNLYPEQRKARPMEDIVEAMRKSDVRIMAVRPDAATAAQRLEATAFEVSYFGPDPNLVQQVTERLAGFFIEENVRQRTLQAQGSADFIRSQLADTRTQLEQTERRLQGYRRQHSDELPSQTQANVQALNNTQLRVQQITESINRDRDRSVLVERQIADLSQPTPEMLITPAPAGGPAAAQPPSALEQLEQARTRLRALEMRYSPEHPDVIRTRRIVAELEPLAKAELERPPEAPKETSRLTAAEVNRRNRLRELRAEADNLKVSIERKQDEERRLEALTLEYQRRIEAAPAREAEMTALLRDYDTLSNQYRTLLTNAKAAEMSEDLERRQGAEQFRLLDPARVPERPVSPDRRRIVLIGAAAGLGLGLAIIGLLEFRDRSMYTGDDVLAALSLPVLAIVPVLTTREEQRRHRKRLVMTVAGAAVVVAVASVIGWQWIGR